MTDGKISGTVGGGFLEAKVREEALRCISDKKPKLLELALDDENADSIGVLCGGQVKIFIEPVQSPPTVYVSGGSHIAVPLVQFAKTLEFPVVVADDRQNFANKERFPQADAGEGRREKEVVRATTSLDNSTGLLPEIDRQFRYCLWFS